MNWDEFQKQQEEEKLKRHLGYIEEFAHWEEVPKKKFLKKRFLRYKLKKTLAVSYYSSSNMIPEQNYPQCEYVFSNNMLFIDFDEYRNLQSNHSKLYRDYLNSVGANVPQKVLLKRIWRNAYYRIKRILRKLFDRKGY